MNYRTTYYYCIGPGVLLPPQSKNKEEIIKEIARAATYSKITSQYLCFILGLFRQYLPGFYMGCFIWNGAIEFVFLKASFSVKCNIP